MPAKDDMNISSIANLATNLAAERNDQAVGIAVLKKALDIESTNAAILLEAIPAAPRLPPNIGQNINTTA